MPLHEPTRRKPLSVLVMPAHSERISLFTPWSTAMVCVIDPAIPVTAPGQRLRDLFGFSRAEVRTAVELLAGNDLRRTADVLSLSYNTVRVHLSRILAKTGTNSQTELIQLMTRVSLLH
jgi:DNA-binding CsgD family transcriptional regulator